MKKAIHPHNLVGSGYKQTYKLSRNINKNKILVNSEKKNTKCVPLWGTEEQYQLRKVKSHNKLISSLKTQWREVGVAALLMLVLTIPSITRPPCRLEVR